jgi:hypothetical protein
MTLVEHLNTINMTAATQATTSNDDGFSIPLCLDDIISICKEFSQLGNQIQSKIENILDMGVEDAINSGKVEQKYLPYIKFFLNKIIANPYFGEAGSQAEDCLRLIYLYEVKHKDTTSVLN